MNAYEVECFKDEFELLKKINHPNVVRVFDLKEDAEAVYLVMEYLNGPSLTAQMEQVYMETGGRGFPEEQAQEILAK